MGTITRRFQEKIDSIVTESYIYAPTDFAQGEPVKRVKIQRSLWDTGASVTLISARVAKVLGLTSIGKSGVSGYNQGIDVKDTFLVHIGLPTRDIITNNIAQRMSFATATWPSPTKTTKQLSHSEYHPNKRLISLKSKDNAPDLCSILFYLSYSPPAFS